MAESTEDVTGAVVVVTGGTGGIGKETAMALAREGATVVVVGRDEARGQAAVTDIVETTGNSDVTFLSADLSSMADVRELGKTVRERFARVDVLVNNAGGLSAERQATVDGHELTFAMNVLSPFLLTRELLPLLEQTTQSRIVNVNTQSFDLPWPFAGYATPDLDDLHLETNYSGMKAYLRSKTANLLWTFELARRLEGSGISVIAVNPGGADTRMQREAQRAVPLPMRVFGAILRPVMARFVNRSAEAAAISSVVAATDPELGGTTGLYLDPHGEPDSTASVARDEKMAAALWEVIVDMVDTGDHVETPTASAKLETIEEELLDSSIDTAAPQ